MFKRNKNKVKSREDQIFNFINITLLLIFTLLIIIPAYNILISSFATSNELAAGFGIFPSKLTIANYTTVLNDPTLWQAFGISVAKTVIGAVTHVLFCSLMAFAMSKVYLKGRKFYVTLGMITMFFGGGMIPTFLLIKSLGLINNFLVYIIPALLSYGDVIFLFNFFRNIPPSLEESAKIDGASEFTIFWRIVLPLSRPALAAFGLMNAVGQWNDFYTALLYINNSALYPLQYRIYRLIVEANVTQGHSGYNPLANLLASSQGIQLATIVITALPILIAYPFLQKYFVSGMMIGAVKE